jgi:2-oxo-4-hydroxy-4-carboxy-5-ureidoimidazoline decarboxylase
VTQPLASLPDTELKAALEKCGLTPAAVQAVLKRGPFADDDALYKAVDVVLLRLDDAELITALEELPAPAVERGDPDAHEAALLAIRLYRDRFGYAFVSGIETPSAEELLMRVRIRLGNDPEPEGRAAREHLRRLVRRRLQEGGRR